MNIYIDFDDVICETAKAFSGMAKRLFGRNVPYENIEFFNLQKSFDLSPEQYDELMKEGHLVSTLLAYEETENASLIINKWVDEGHNVSVMTGRPFSAYEPSRKWLDDHGLSRVPLYCVDKYGREIFNFDSTFSLSLQEFYEREFDFIVEDSPEAFKHLSHFPGSTVAVFNRPWNKKCDLPDETYVRCSGWKEIDKLLSSVIK